MNKTKDILYAIFMGLVMYLAGAVILGGAQYFINLYFSMDFISVILYFFLSRVITKQLLKGMNSRGKFYTILFCIYTGLMYLLKDYVAFSIVLLMSGYKFTDLLLSVPYIMYFNFISAFSINLSIDGFFSGIINLLINVIEILIMGAGIYDAYRITKVY